MRYKIRSADGVEVEGQTDDEGRTMLFAGDKIEKIELLYVAVDMPVDEGVS